MFQYKLGTQPTFTEKFTYFLYVLRPSYFMVSHQNQSEFVGFAWLQCEIGWNQVFAWSCGIQLNPNTKQNSMNIKASRLKFFFLNV